MFGGLGVAAVVLLGLVHLVGLGLELLAQVLQAHLARLQLRLGLGHALLARHQLIGQRRGALLVVARQQTGAHLETIRSEMSFTEFYRVFQVDPILVGFAQSYRLTMEVEWVSLRFQESYRVFT